MFAKRKKDVMLEFKIYRGQSEVNTHNFEVRVFLRFLMKFVVITIIQYKKIRKRWLHRYSFVKNVKCPTRLFKIQIINLTKKSKIYVYHLILFDYMMVWILLILNNIALFPNVELKVENMPNSDYRCSIHLQYRKKYLV